MALLSFVIYRTQDVVFPGPECGIPSCGIDIRTAVVLGSLLHTIETNYQ